MKRQLVSIELLIGAIGVIAVMAVVLIPLLGGKDVTQASYRRLKVLHRAIAIYQENQGGGVGEGTFFDMALPPFNVVANDSRLGVPEREFICPCLEGRTSIPRTVSLEFAYAAGSFENTPYILDRRNMLFSTLGCNEDLDAVYAPYVKHWGLGVRIDGQFVNLRKVGSPADPAWWRVN